MHRLGSGLAELAGERHVGRTRMDDVKPGTLELFKVHYSCKSCLHAWDGYAHGFARGHLVFERGQRVAFVADDIWYGLPNGTSFSIPDLLEPLGWHLLETCPRCRSANLKSDDLANSPREHVPCEDVGADSFEKVGETWSLTRDARKRLE